MNPVFQLIEYNIKIRVIQYLLILCLCYIIGIFYDLTYFHILKTNEKMEKIIKINKFIHTFIQIK